MRTPGVVYRAESFNLRLSWVRWGRGVQVELGLFPSISVHTEQWGEPAPCLLSLFLVDQFLRLVKACRIVFCV